MKNIIKDYLKCVVANKATLAGYVFLVGSIALNFRDAEANKPETLKNILYTASAMNLIGSRLGLGTLNHYRRAREFIQRTKKTSLRYQNEIMSYCERVGWEVAIKESKLEKKLSASE